MAEVNDVGKSKMAAACPQIENLTFNLRKRCKILRKSSPPHYLALAASLLQVTAIDEGGFGGVKAGNSCEKCQIMEKIRLYGLPRFDFEWVQVATGVKQQINFMPAAVAPEIQRLAQAGVAHQYLEYGSYFGEWRRRNALKMWTGWPTMPMVFVKGVLVGGAEDVERLIAGDELKALLA